jgi:hypothetical protein
VMRAKFGVEIAEDCNADGVVAHAIDCTRGDARD